jgi:VWFA-related protein
MGVFRISLLLCLLFLVLPLESQNSTPVTPPPTTLSVDVNVVTLPVTVRDKKGKIVTSLTKDDFVLEEDGKPQNVRYFNQENNLPLTVGLLVDTSMSERDNLEKERAASRTFLDQMITKPKDRAFVVHFDREVELLQDLTGDHGKLEKAVGEIDTQSSVTAVTDQDNNGASRPHRGAGTLLYDAIFLACDEIMKKQTGRKAVVILTDGEDRGSQETLNSAIESAQRSETEIYTVYYGGHEDHDRGFSTGGPDDNDPYGRGGYPGGRRYPGGGYPGGGYPGGSRPRQVDNRPSGKKILQKISQETGGRYFEVKKNDVDEVYASIAEELRTQFILGYTPPKDQASGYHSIHLTTKNKDQIVQTRAGYFTGQENSK